MAFPFGDLEVEPRLRPNIEGYAFDLDRALASVVALAASVPDDAFTAASLGTERIGNGVVIGPHGLVLTMGYLVMEAETIALIQADGREVAAHVLGADPVTGFGLAQALEPLDLPVLPLGDSHALAPGAPVIVAGAGGRAHAVAGRLLTRMPFAGYWEYLLDDALMTEPAHPHWSGAALIGPDGRLAGLASLNLHRQTRAGVQPMNMCVPIERLPPILDDLARGQSPFPPRPWLGVLSQQVRDKVVIIGVSPNGPASRAEIRPGDVILAVAGETVTDLEGFYSRLWGLGPAGVTAPLTVQRETDVFDVDVRSADRTALLRRPRYN